MRVGNNQHYKGNGLVIVGNNNTVEGNNNSVTGNNNNIRGNNNSGCGNNNSISGNNNKWTGNNNTLKGNGNTVVTGNNNRTNGKRSGGGGGISIAGSNFGVKNITMQNGRIWIDGVESVGGGDDDGVVHNIFTPSGLITTVGGGQISTGTLGGGMYMSNAKGPTKKPKGTRPESKKRERSPSPSQSPKKRERSEPEPELLFTEVPTKDEADADVLEYVMAKSAAKAARVEGEPKKAVPKCVVCLKGAPKCVILPCLHQCVCSTCARELGKNGEALRGTAKCPMCRAGVDAIKKPFLV